MANALNVRRIVISVPIKEDVQSVNQGILLTLKDFVKHHVNLDSIGTTEMMAAKTVQEFIPTVQNASNPTMLMFLNHMVSS